MLAEIAQFLRHAPATLALKVRSSQDELYSTIADRMDDAGMADRRRELVADLRGDIVEIGCGTGHQFRHYAPGVRVRAVEPDPAFAARARAGAPAGFEVVEARGEQLPFADASADAAVVALVLCSVDAPDAVCAEIARVVRPGGAVRLIEHVVSPKRVAGALMHAVDPIWLRLNGQGCHMDRDPFPALERARFAIERVEPFQVWAPGVPAFPWRAIYARRQA
nr:methyltransferase domain-containing protein [Kofleriaceae bacterium]